MFQRVLKIGAEIELCAIRSDIRRREKELGEIMKRNEFQFRCGFYWQLAMQMMVCPQYDANDCERMGALCGRLIRFSRVLDISDEVSVELANTSIRDVVAEFNKQSEQVRHEIAGQAFGLLDLLPVPDVMKADMRAMWGKELHILGVQLPNSISVSDRLSVALADDVNRKMSRAECAAAIMQSMAEQFKTGTEQVNSDFALRTMALTLAGIVNNCQKKRKEFLNFMANAWDEHMAARRKLDAAS
jgi:hypothetical protein